jgi:hypothetical protein
MSATEVQRLYQELNVGERVEVVHLVKIGDHRHESRTAGTIVRKGRMEGGVDSGVRRWWDEKQWFDHLLLRRDDGELTTVTVDEYTSLRRLM